MLGRSPAAFVLAFGLLVMYVIVAAPRVATAEPLEQIAWVVLGSLLAGTLVWGARLCRALRAAESETARNVARWRHAQANARRYRAELDEIRKRHLGDLAHAVQTLLVTLQERGQELEEEENWWKHGGRDE